MSRKDKKNFVYGDEKIVTSMSSKSISSSSRVHNSIHRLFYSFCRNVESFENVDFSSNIPTIINLLRRRASSGDINNKYIFVLKSLNDKILHNIISPEEAVYCLIEVMDECLDIFEMYKENSDKNEIAKAFGFYDSKFIRLELIYYREFNDKLEENRIKRKKLK